MATKIKKEITAEEQLARWREASAQGGKKSGRRLNERISVVIAQVEPSLKGQAHADACSILNSAYYRAVAHGQSDIDLASLWVEASAEQN